MPPFKSFKEVMERAKNIKTFEDVTNLFRDVFGEGAIATDESAEAEAFRSVLGVEQSIADSAEKAAFKANLKRLQGIGYTKNCQRCIAVFEMRMRGYLVIAKPKTRPAKEDGIYSSQNCFKNPIIIGKRGGISQPSLDKHLLLQHLQNLGDGARAAICWTRPGTGRKGHTIACEITAGRVKFVDPQTGHLGDRVLGEADEDGYSFFRMDNLEFDEQKLALIAEREPS